MLFGRAGNSSSRPQAPAADRRRPARGKSEDFSLESFFAGCARAHGVVHDRFGRVRRRFLVDLIGRWDGRALVLDEDFAYDDGAREHRTWHITKIAERRLRRGATRAAAPT